MKGTLELYMYSCGGGGARTCIAHAHAVFKKVADTGSAINRWFLALNFPKMSVCLHYLAIVVILCCGFVDESWCQTSLSSQDQQELLNAHNHYRGLVNPTASNMQRMVRLWRYWQISKFK